MIVNSYGQGGGSYLEPGDHLVYIFEVKDNDRASTPGIDVLFKSDEGRTIKDTFWTNDKSLWRITNLAIACGLANGPKDETLKRLNTNSFVGHQVMIRVVKETSAKDGKEYSTVKTFWKPAATTKAPAAAKDDGCDDKGFEAYDNNEKDPF